MNYIMLFECHNYLLSSTNSDITALIHDIHYVMLCKKDYIIEIYAAIVGGKKNIGAIAFCLCIRTALCFDVLRSFVVCAQAYAFLVHG